MSGSKTEETLAARESRILIGKSSLYLREIGRGQPIIVLHGGPDFDHRYLLPDMDRLATAYRLIYYDQRGRGRSGEHVRPEDVTLVSEIEDLDKVREYFQLESTALLGHSSGTILALEYALRHPKHVSHMILMNSAPASASDYAAFRQAYAQKLGDDLYRQQEIMDLAAYKDGEPETVTARYRLHYNHALKREEDLDRLMTTMKAAFISQKKQGIVKAQAIEDRLMRDTWLIDDYDLMPKLGSLNIPTLVIYGKHDFVPEQVASHIASAIPNSNLVTFDCGHFAYLECPDEVRSALKNFFQRS